jgi:HSP20 family protein
MRHDIDDIVQLFDEVESLVAGFWEFQFPSAGGIWSPATDVFVAGQEVIVLVEVPGVARKDLKVAISPVLLEVSGLRPTPEFFSRGTNFYELEIAYGAFRKRIALPARVDPRRVKTQLRDGLLSLRLPLAKTPPASLTEKGS